MRNALWLDSLTITEEPRRSYDGKMRWGCVPANVLDHCLKCGVPADRLYKHGASPKKYADLPAHGHHVHIAVWVQRYRCRECSGTFDHPLPEMPAAIASMQPATEAHLRDLALLRFLQLLPHP